MGLGRRSSVTSEHKPKEPVIAAVGNLEITIREVLGDREEPFAIIEIYDEGLLMDSIAVAAKSPAFREGVFLLEFAHHYFTRPRPIGEGI